jgi:hypothetical protein
MSGSKARLGEDDAMLFKINCNRLRYVHYYVLLRSNAKIIDGFSRYYNLQQKY